MSLSISSRRRTTIAVAATALGIVIGALAGPGWLVIGALAAVTVTWVMLLPRLAAPVLAVGLVVQDVLARNLDTVEPTLAAAVKSLDEIALLAAFVRVIALLASGDRQWFRFRDWLWAVVFLIAGLLSSLWHWVGLTPAVIGLALSCKFFGFLMLSLSIPWEPEDGARLVRVVAWAAPLVFALGLCGFVFRDFTMAHFAALEGDVEYTRGGFVPFMVPFVNPGLFGWTMAVTALAAFALVVEGRQRGAVLALVAAAAGAVLSLRRRPLLGIPIAIAAALTQLNARQRIYAAAVTAVVIALIGFFGGELIRATVSDTLANYLDPTARANTARGAMLATSLLIGVRAFPLGVGFGRFGGYASQLFYSRVYDDYGLSGIYGLSPEAPYYITDTYWPHLLGETGVIGMLAMLALLGTIWLRTRAVFRTARLPEPIRLVGLFGALVLLEGLVESLGGPVFEVSLQSFIIALPVGMAIRLSRTWADSVPATVGAPPS